MFRTILSLMFLLAVAASSAAIAQEEPVQESPVVLKARPFLEANYGMAAPSFKDAGFDYESIGTLEFKIGYGALDRSAGSIVELMAGYLFFSMANPDLGSSGGEGDESSEFLRFGLGSRLGVGYQGEKRGLDLYNQNALAWTEFTAADGATPGAEAQAVYDRYGDQNRFGHVMEAGADVRLSTNLALSLGAEGAVIYPRYVFWPWLGSAMIYSALQSVVEYFADSVMESSPSMGPVIYFLLKTGLSAGYYFASQDDMSWPFDREQPVTVASLKFGATFAF